ncbi:hypothetical protein [Paracoccus acridae]|uniref:hypothetical protein n=1 Tax=Paracoccus acridae TaxID=1795310 RepID=UPI001664ECED|nr:hypothetical protein [Paracoccus acridae]
MEVTGMLTGAPLLAHVGFPATEVLGPDGSGDQIQAMIDRHGLPFINPVFRWRRQEAKGRADRQGARPAHDPCGQGAAVFRQSTAMADGATFEAGVPPNTRSTSRLQPTPGLTCKSPKIFQSTAEHAGLHQPQRPRTNFANMSVR